MGPDSFTILSRQGHESADDASLSYLINRYGQKDEESCSELDTLLLDSSNHTDRFAPDYITSTSCMPRRYYHDSLCTKRNTSHGGYKTSCGHLYRKMLDRALTSDYLSRNQNHISTSSTFYSASDRSNSHASNQIVPCNILQMGFKRLSRADLPHRSISRHNNLSGKRYLSVDSHSICGQLPWWRNHYSSTYRNLSIADMANHHNLRVQHLPPLPRSQSCDGPIMRGTTVGLAVSGINSNSCWRRSRPGKKGCCRFTTDYNKQLHGQTRDSTEPLLAKSPQKVETAGEEVHTTNKGLGATVCKTMSQMLEASPRGHPSHLNQLSQAVASTIPTRETNVKNQIPPVQNTTSQDDAPSSGLLSKSLCCRVPRNELHGIGEDVDGRDKRTGIAPQQLSSTFVHRTWAKTREGFKVHATKRIVTAPMTTSSLYNFGATTEAVLLSPRRRRHICSTDSFNKPLQAGINKLSMPSDPYRNRAWLRTGNHVSCVTFKDREGLQQINDIGDKEKDEFVMKAVGNTIEICGDDKDERQSQPESKIWSTNITGPVRSYETFITDSGTSFVRRRTNSGPTSDHLKYIKNGDMEKLPQAKLKHKVNEKTQQGVPNQGDAWDRRSKSVECLFIKEHFTSKATPSRYFSSKNMMDMQEASNPSTVLNTMEESKKERKPLDMLPTAWNGIEWTVGEGEPHKSRYKYRGNKYMINGERESVHKDRENGEEKQDEQGRKCERKQNKDGTATPSANSSLVKNRRIDNCKRYPPTCIHPQTLKQSSTGKAVETESASVNKTAAAKWCVKSFTQQHSIGGNSKAGSHTENEEQNSLKQKEDKKQPGPRRSASYFTSKRPEHATDDTKSYIRKSKSIIDQSHESNFKWNVNVYGQLEEKSGLTLADQLITYDVSCKSQTISPRSEGVKLPSNVIDTKNLKMIRKTYKEGIEGDNVSLLSDCDPAFVCLRNQVGVTKDVVRQVSAKDISKNKTEEQDEKVSEEPKHSDQSVPAPNLSKNYEPPRSQAIGTTKSKPLMNSEDRPDSTDSEPHSIDIAHQESGNTIGGSPHTALFFALQWLEQRATMRSSLMRSSLSTQPLLKKYTTNRSRLYIPESYIAGPSDEVLSIDEDCDEVLGEPLRPFRRAAKQLHGGGSIASSRGSSKSRKSIRFDSSGDSSGVKYNQGKIPPSEIGSKQPFCIKSIGTSVDRKTVDSSQDQFSEISYYSSRWSGPSHQSYGRDSDTSVELSTAVTVDIPRIELNVPDNEKALKYSLTALADTNKSEDVSKGIKVNDMNDTKTEIENQSVQHWLHLQAVEPEYNEGSKNVDTAIQSDGISRHVEFVDTGSVNLIESLAYSWIVDNKGNASRVKADDGSIDEELKAIIKKSRAKYNVPSTKLSMSPSVKSSRKSLRSSLGGHRKHRSSAASSVPRSGSRASSAKKFSVLDDLTAKYFHQTMPDKFGDHQTLSDTNKEDSIRDGVLKTPIFASNDAVEESSYEEQMNEQYTETTVERSEDVLRSQSEETALKMAFGTCIDSTHQCEQTHDSRPVLGTPVDPAPKTTTAKNRAFSLMVFVDDDEDEREISVKSLNPTAFEQSTTSKKLSTATSNSEKYTLNGGGPKGKLRRVFKRVKPPVPGIIYTPLKTFRRKSFFQRMTPQQLSAINNASVALTVSVSHIPYPQLDGAMSNRTSASHIQVRDTKPRGEKKILKQSGSFDSKFKQQRDKESAENRLPLKISEKRGQPTQADEAERNSSTAFSEKTMKISSNTPSYKREKNVGSKRKLSKLSYIEKCQCSCVCSPFVCPCKYCGNLCSSTQIRRPCGYISKSSASQIVGRCSKELDTHYHKSNKWVPRGESTPSETTVVGNDSQDKGDQRRGSEENRSLRKDSEEDQKKDGLEEAKKKDSQEEEDQSKKSQESQVKNSIESQISDGVDGSENLARSRLVSHVKVAKMPDDVHYKQRASEKRYSQRQRYSSFASVGIDVTKMTVKKETLYARERNLVQAQKKRYLEEQYFNKLQDGSLYNKVKEMVFIQNK